MAVEMQTSQLPEDHTPPGPTGLEDGVPQRIAQLRAIEAEGFRHFQVTVLPTADSPATTDGPTRPARILFRQLEGRRRPVSSDLPLLFECSNLIAFPDQSHPDPNGVSDLGLREDLPPCRLCQAPLCHQVTLLPGAVPDHVGNIRLIETEQNTPHLLPRDRRNALRWMLGTGESVEKSHEVRL